VTGFVFAGIAVLGVAVGMASRRPAPAIVSSSTEAAA
jgi:hypothetical protein